MVDQLAMTTSNRTPIRRRLYIAGTFSDEPGGRARRLAVSWAEQQRLAMERR